jgi:perosamine synthetase
MTTIEGGMVLTDDEAISQRIRIIRSQGEDPHRKYHHIELGHNFRMTELQAAIGLAQMAKLDDLLESRCVLASRYRTEFSARGLEMPTSLPSAESGNFLFSLLMPQRDSVMARLKQRGIEMRACYPTPLYEQPIFTQYKTGICPVSEDICSKIINPPMFFGMTMGQQQRVVSEMLSAMQELSRNAA